MHTDKAYFISVSLLVCNKCNCQLLRSCPSFWDRKDFKKNKFTCIVYIWSTVIFQDHYVSEILYCNIIGGLVISG